MNDKDMTRLEARLRTAAATLQYPPTPNVAGAVRRRLRKDAPVKRLHTGPRLAWVAVALALAVFILLAVPEVRAGLIEFFQIGIVRIFPVAPTATRLPAGAPVVTPRPTPTPIPSVLDLYGETALADAQKQAPFPIKLPTYPADLGQPDQVFSQFLGGSVVVLVWFDESAKVSLALHIIENDSFAIEKIQPRLVERTIVNGRPAIWAEGPYMVQIRNGDYDARRLIEGHVLIWSEGGVTYRLETDLPMDEAVKIAESLE